MKEEETTKVRQDNFKEVVNYLDYVIDNVDSSYEEGQPYDPRLDLNNLRSIILSMIKYIKEHYVPKTE